MKYKKQNGEKLKINKYLKRIKTIILLEFQANITKDIRIRI